MSSITFLVSAVLTVFALHALDESNMAHAVDGLDQSVQVLAESAIDETIKNDFNQVVRSDVVDASNTKQSKITSRVKSKNSISAI